MVRRLIALVLIITPLISLSADVYSPIESLMTEGELKGSGVGQLSKAKRKFLNEWIQMHLVTRSFYEPLSNETDLEPKKDEVKSIGFEQGTDQKIDSTLIKAKIIYLDKQSEEVIASRIRGKFVGWRGKTLFELQNGQIWKQRYSGYWKISLKSPEVSIKRSGAGAYEMEIVPKGKKIGVKRVR